MTHQVDIKFQSTEGTQNLYDLRTKGDIGDKMAIHNVQMQPVSPTFTGANSFGSKLGEVRCKQ
jgi:hypothetical protein